MTETLTNQSKNTASMANLPSNAPKNITWDMSTESWDDATGTWDTPGMVFVNNAQHTVILTNL